MRVAHRGVSRVGVGGWFLGGVGFNVLGDRDRRSRRGPPRQHSDEDTESDGTRHLWIFGAAM